MANKITYKPLVTTTGPQFNYMSGESSVIEEQAVAGVWEQSGVVSGSVVLTGFLATLQQYGLAQVTNNGEKGTHRNFTIGLASGGNYFMLLKPGDQFVFRTYHTTPLYWLVPDGAGTDAPYTFTVFEE